MNKLTRDQQVAVISALTEGVSVRGTERLTGVHRDTVLRTLVRVGTTCQSIMDLSMRDLPCTRIQVDEQWTYVGRKQRHMTASSDASREGDFWLWNCVDETSRAVVTTRVGKRTAHDAQAFMADVSSRMRNRVQVSADGLALYVEAVERAFGGQVDFGQIVKSYEAEPMGPGRYSPPRVSAVERTVVQGSPEAISTSYVERLHLENRMKVRRLTRLTDAFSRKLENLKAAMSVQHTTYNFVKRHKSLDGATPAMALGVTDHRWTVGDIIDLTDWRGVKSGT